MTISRNIGRGVRYLTRTSRIDAFWAKSAKTDTCWPWNHAADRNGYGRFYWRGRVMVSSRVAWEIANGKELRDEECVLHSCDNGSCVNPEHLRVGTQVENMLEAVAKGRVPRSLTICQARFIRAISGKFPDVNRRAIASLFRVNVAVINDLIANRTWRWLPLGG